MRDRQTDRRALAEPTWEEDPVSGAAQNFCCFLFGFCFFSFSFFLHAFLLAGFLYCVHEWAQHFYLIYVDISLPCLLFYVTFRCPPSLSHSLFPCLRCGWQFVWLFECLYFPLLFRLCVQKPPRETGRQRGRRGDAYILLVLVVDIYFMSQITFIGTWHTLEIHV